jgi:hypothetical protein
MRRRQLMRLVLADGVMPGIEIPPSPLARADRVTE